MLRYCTATSELGSKIDFNHLLPEEISLACVALVLFFCNIIERKIHLRAVFDLSCSLQETSLKTLMSKSSLEPQRSVTGSARTSTVSCFAVDSVVVHLQYKGAAPGLRRGDKRRVFTTAHQSSDEGRSAVNRDDVR